MRGLRRGLSTALLAALSTGPAAGADDNPVVVTVGNIRVHASEITRRLAALPAVQLRTLGDTPESIRRRYVDSVLVPELLYGAAAHADKLDEAPWVQQRIHEVYHRAVRDAVRRDAVKAQPITDADVAAYYDAHHDEFHQESRMLLWRIVVDDPALAARILNDARGAGGPDRWRKLAQEHSLDVATRLRAGTLGFVGPHGDTDVPQVRVDPALYEAAQDVRDGELVPAPVHEGEHLAVVWRRGTRPAVDRSLDEARDDIVQILERERATKALTELLAQLRRAHLTDHHPEWISRLPTPAPETLRPSRALASAVRPPRGPAAPASGSPAPRTGDDGLR